VAKLTQSELETHLWKAADILRGHVDAGKFKDYIFGLLFYKRLCDVWDEEFEVLLAETGDREEAAEPDEHRFHVPAEHRWDAVRKHSTQIGQHLNNAFAAIEDANLRLRGVFGDIDFANQERFPDARLESLLAHFEKHRLRNADVPADMLGDAYMYLIKQFADSAGKSGGEFYTPRQVVRLIVECLQPQPGMSIYDPTCGSGGMLLEAVQYVKDHGGNARSLSLFGQEKELDTWSIAEINLFLHDIDDAFIAEVLRSLDGAIAAAQAHATASLKVFRSVRDQMIEEARFQSSEISVANALAKNRGEKLRKLQTAYYREGGAYPIVDQGADFICGYTDDEDALWPYALPVIVFGDHTRALKFVDFPFVIGADGTQCLSARPGIHPRFLYYAIQSLDLRSEGYARHFKLLKEKTIPIPDEAAQAEIAETLLGLERAHEAAVHWVERAESLKTVVAVDLLNGRVRVPA